MSAELSPVPPIPGPNIQPVVFSLAPPRRILHGLFSYPAPTPLPACYQSLHLSNVQVVYKKYFLLYNLLFNPPRQGLGQRMEEERGEEEEEGEEMSYSRSLSLEDEEEGHHDGQQPTLRPHFSD